MGILVYLSDIGGISERRINNWWVEDFKVDESVALITASAVFS